MYGGVLDDMNFDNLNMIMNVKSDATMEERYESVIELIEVHMEKKGFNPETYWSELVKPDEIPWWWSKIEHANYKDPTTMTRKELSQYSTTIDVSGLTQAQWDAQQEYSRISPEDHIINGMKEDAIFNDRRSGMEEMK
jgi:hypothetical protein